MVRLGKESLFKGNKGQLKNKSESIEISKSSDKRNFKEWI